MKITVVGTGYVGLVAGTCLSDMGNNVICVDNVEEKVELLKKGVIPIYEPGLKDIFDINVEQGRLTFTTDLKKGVDESDVIFIAVGTPPGKNHEADLSGVLAVARDIGKYMTCDKIVVDKSTVPVGTGKKVKKAIEDNMTGDYKVHVVSNPEFLREGAAVKDFMAPDRVVIGVDSKYAEEVMTKIYHNCIRPGNPLLATTIESAELIKYASNAFLATKISFMNEIARLCEKVNADVKQVALGMGLDNRIGPRFLQAGLGYGGSCFPKDVQALNQTGFEYETPFKILQAVEDINAEQRVIMLDKIKSIYPDLKGKKVTLWGLAFKPQTDDIREAPAIDIIKALLHEGADVFAFDPVAQDNVKEVYPDITYGTEPYEICRDADVLLLITEWNAFRDLDFSKVKSLMKTPVLIDGRNIYERNNCEELGFTYIGFGR